jgi:hypothetical protein
MGAHEFTHRRRLVSGKSRRAIQRYASRRLGIATPILVTNDRGRPSRLGPSKSALAPKVNKIAPASSATFLLPQTSF